MMACNGRQRMHSHYLLTVSTTFWCASVWGRGCFRPISVPVFPHLAVALWLDILNKLFKCKMRDVREKNEVNELIRIKRFETICAQRSRFPCAMF